MPVGVASGNLWLVRLATFIMQPMEHTNHKFPAAMATGVPSEVKSTVQYLDLWQHNSSSTSNCFRNITITSIAITSSSG